MSDPFIAEIKMFGGNFAPRGYAFCDGQILAISQNTALFSLLGTTYGGNGTTNFALPDLRGRAPLGNGQGPGLTAYVLGAPSGTETVTLQRNQMPAHRHTPQGSTAAGSSASPANNVWAASVGGRTPPPLHSTVAPSTAMAAATIASQGSNQPHANRQPYLGVNFIIALQGIFPPRS